MIIVVWRWVIPSLIRVVVRIKELDHEDILCVMCLLVEPVEEFSHADIVVLQELNYVHLLAILHLLGDISV